MRSLLLIEDDPIMGESLQQRFELESYDVRWVRRIAEASGMLEERWNIVVCDVRLPDGLATEWFSRLPGRIRSIPWYFLTGYGSVNDAIAAIRAGAREYLAKPFDIERLVGMVNSVASQNVDEDEPVLGVSPAMRRAEEMVRKVASQRVSVLLTGESGVGKEVAAQLIHRLDPVSGKGSFVAVNCAAVPDSMFEAEFFGYERGAFTGATRMHRGFLEQAHGGTLFLDEVGELSPGIQAKLLRAMQERCFFRLGAEKTTTSSFRIIAATNRDLYGAMIEGVFREDLFYRLAVIRITLPPLRERPEDVRWLAGRMMQQMVLEHGRPLAVSEAFMLDLVGRPWRGNARELRSHLEQAVILNSHGILDVESSAGVRSADGDEGPFEPLHAKIEQTERLHIQRALDRSGRSISKTADLLGISRKTLWEKMKRLKIGSESRA